MLVEHVAAIDGPAGRDDLEDRTGDRARRARREHLLRTLARRRKHLQALALDEHDGDAVEGNELAHLADERAERLFENEGRPERPGTPVRGFENVHAAAERVAQLLRFRRTLLRDRALAPQAKHEPADDQADDHLAAGLEGDVIRSEGVVGMLCAQTLELDEHRDREHRQEQRADDREANRRLGHGEVEHLTDRAPALEVVDEEVRGEDRRVEEERDHGEPELLRGTGTPSG